MRWQRDGESVIYTYVYREREIERDREGESLGRVVRRALDTWMASRY